MRRKCVLIPMEDTLINFVTFIRTPPFHINSSWLNEWHWVTHMIMSIIDWFIVLITMCKMLLYTELFLQVLKSSRFIWLMACKLLYYNGHTCTSITQIFTSLYSSYFIMRNSFINRHLPSISLYSCSFIQRAFQ